VLIVLDHQALRALSPAEQNAVASPRASTEAAQPVARPRRAIVIGNFDGVHRGHQELFLRARALLRSLSDDTSAATSPGQVVALTFWPHPTRVLAKTAAPPLITSRQRRRELLSQCGVDILIEQPFDLGFAALSPTQFVSDLLRDSLQADVVCVGYDFNFGKGRSGNAETLRALLAEAGMQALVVPAFAVPTADAASSEPSPSASGQATTICSSSGIRKAVQEGRVSEAARLLGRAVEIEGVVEHGAARGRQLGFPTANLRLDAELTPAVGIYAAWAEILGPLPDSTPSSAVSRSLFYRPVLARHPAAVSVGYNATFTARPIPKEASSSAPPTEAAGAGSAGGQTATWPQLSIEAHLIQPDGSAWLDLYGQTLRLTLVARLRDEQRFPSVDALRAQIAADVATTKALLGVTG
jgi:riboflavin kinase/FMN adenylyltransferase